MWYLNRDRQQIVNTYLVPLPNLKSKRTYYNNNNEDEEDVKFRIEPGSWGSHLDTQF